MEGARPRPDGRSLEEHVLFPIFAMVSWSLDVVTHILHCVRVFQHQQLPSSDMNLHHNSSSLCVLPPKACHRPQYLPTTYYTYLA